VVSKSFLLVLTLLIILTANSIFGSGPWSWGIGFTYIGYDSALLLFVSLQMIRILKEKAERLPSELPRPTLAVLITAKNEATVLKSCLEALDAQSDLPDFVYWIDDGSSDDTRERLAAFQFQRLSGIITRFKPHSGKADSLNRVWPEVPADVLVTLDADTLLEADAILEIRRAFALNPNLAATGGLLTPMSIHYSGRLFETFQRFEYIRSFLSRRAWMSKNTLLLVSGAFAAYRKTALEQVGGYDPRSLVEDYDLIHRIHRYSYDHGLHYEVDVTVAARATTDVPVTLKQFLRQRRRWFAGFLQTQFKNGDMIGNKKYGKLGDTLQPIFGLITLATLVWLILSRSTINPWIWKALLAKIILDLIFHYGSVALYYRWRGERVHRKTWALSTLATFLEPVSFQVLRHFGALLGWKAFLSGNSDWAPQRINNAETKP
jgi:cellulose synthase/poly-beta-1,6-N-acetylglucosamine synthase-like glycosyltransferase